MLNYGHQFTLRPTAPTFVLVSNAREKPSPVTGHPVPVLSVATAVSASPPPKAGLPLQQELASGSALVTDQNTGKVLYSRNPDLVVPIASITKLMTAMVVLDSKLPLDEVLPIAISETSEMRGCFPGCGSAARSAAGTCSCSP